MSALRSLASRAVWLVLSLAFAAIAPLVVLAFLAGGALMMLRDKRDAERFAPHAQPRKGDA